jgi:hypothetical protein
MYPGIASRMEKELKGLYLDRQGWGAEDVVEGGQVAARWSVDVVQEAQLK